jgi:hypothetical protein
MAPEDRLHVLREALAPTFLVVSGMAARMLSSRHLECSRAESDALAEAWAPLAVAHYDELVKGLPWAVAIGRTWEIGAPKVSAMLRDREAAKLEGATPAELSTVPAPASDAPRE